jgi:hypothetical protein
MFHNVPVIWQYVILSGGALGLTMVGLWLYNRREARRKNAIELMKLMNRWGLDWFADLYEDYAVGDYAGLAVKVREVLVAVRSDEAMVAKLAEVAKKVAAFYAANDPTKAQDLLTILQSAKPAVAAVAGTVTSTPTAAAPAAKT